MAANQGTPSKQLAAGAHRQEDRRLAILPLGEFAFAGGSSGRVPEVVDPDFVASCEATGISRGWTAEGAPILWDPFREPPKTRPKDASGGSRHEEAVVEAEERCESSERRDDPLVQVTMIGLREASGLLEQHLLELGGRRLLSLVARALVCWGGRLRHAPLQGRQYFDPASPPVYRGLPNDTPTGWAA